MAMRLTRTHAPQPAGRVSPERPDAVPELSVSLTGESGVVMLHGRLDGAAREVIDAGLRGQPEGALVFDLYGVSEVDAAGLGHLVRVRNQRPGSHGRVVIRRPQPHVRDLLAVTGLDRVFPIED